MKKLILLGVLLFALTACAAPKEAAETQAPSVAPATNAHTTDAHTTVATATPTPSQGAVLTKSFQIYGEDVTVTVAYGPKGTEDTVTIERAGVEPQKFTEANPDGGEAPEIIVEDMDFDGNLDFRFCSATLPTGTDEYYCYRWNSTYLQFERAEELNGLTGLGFNAEKELIYSHSRSARMGIEYIFRWTGGGVTPLRKLAWERDFGGERTVYEVYDKDTAAPDSEDAWRLLAQWETVDASEPEMELSSWLDPVYYGENVKIPAYIPDDLLELLTPLVDNDGSFAAVLERYAADQRAVDARDAYEGYIADDEWADVWGGWCYLADVDNDGIDDMPLFKDVGTGHYTTLYFLKGDGSGGYKNAFTVPLNRADRCWCISWKGVRYLVSGAGIETGEWHYRRFSGLNLYLLEDGQVRDRVFLSLDDATGAVTRYRWTQGENIDFPTADWSWAWNGE